MYSMLSTPLICCSIGDATESASVFESAPGYVADTVTCTGVIDGYCATGSCDIDTTPARQMTSATTAAKIGRSMKNRENMRRGTGRYCTTIRSTRRASLSFAPPVTLTGATSSIRLGSTPSVTSSSRTAVARFFASSTLAAALPVRSA